MSFEAFGRTFFRFLDPDDDTTIYVDGSLIESMVGFRDDDTKKVTKTCLRLTPCVSQGGVMGLKIMQQVVVKGTPQYVRDVMTGKVDDEPVKSVTNDTQV